MQTTPNKPEVFAGWQESFPPINLNFTTPILRIVRKSATFIMYNTEINKQINNSLFASSLEPISDFDAVCRKAYFNSYHRFRLLPAIPHPFTFGSK